MKVITKRYDTLNDLESGIFERRDVWESMSKGMQILYRAVEKIVDVRMISAWQHHFSGFPRYAAGNIDEGYRTIAKAGKKFEAMNRSELMDN